MKEPIKPITKFIIFSILGHALALLVISFPAMLLWNWMMPLLFGFVTISYFQTIGVVIVLSLAYQVIK